jgi:cell division control protein 6
MLRQLIPGFPLRGFGVDELLRMFTLLLFEQNLVTLLVLDEIDYLIDDRTDFLYSLSRIEESPPVYESHYSNPTNINTESRFSLLMITRDKNFRHYLDSSTASSLGRNFIFFPPYTRNQLFDIICARAELGLREECYNDELLEAIASLAEEYGDARFAIELLWKAGKLADKENADCIVPEHVRKAVVAVLPMEKSIIEELNCHQQLILTDGQTKVTTPEVKQYYQQICEEASIRARRPTQVWAYLKDLSRLGLIIQEVENRHNQKGRSLGRVTTIKIRDIPVTDIIQSLNHLIED